jgi:ribonuclease HII
MQETTFEKERAIALQGEFLVVGVDEAGRGPLCGPVVAAAVCYKRPDFAIPPELESDFALIRDSKKLSEKQREKTYALIEEHFFVGIGIVHAYTIDRINILEATFLAMKVATSDLLKQMRKDTRSNDQETNKDAQFCLLIDGNQEIPNLSLRQETVVGGDGTVKSIAAASIIAKVTRDRMMEHDKEYPEYGFLKHKGYGTKLPGALRVWPDSYPSYVFQAGLL